MRIWFTDTTIDTNTPIFAGLSILLQLEKLVYHLVFSI